MVGEAYGWDNSHGRHWVGLFLAGVHYHEFMVTTYVYTPDALRRHRLALRAARAGLG